MKFGLHHVGTAEGLDIDFLQADVDDVDRQGFQLREGAEDSSGVGPLLGIQPGRRLLIEAGLPVQKVSGLAVLGDENQVGVAEVHVGDGNLEFHHLPPRASAEEVVPVVDGAGRHVLLVLGQASERAGFDGFVNLGSFQRDWVNRTVIVLLKVRTDGDFAEARGAALGVLSLRVVLCVAHWGCRYR